MRYEDIDVDGFLEITIHRTKDQTTRPALARVLKYDPKKMRFEDTPIPRRPSGR